MRTDSPPGPMSRVSATTADPYLLDELDLPPGAHVVEIGCGPRGCLDLLAERVGPHGLVIGVEPNEESVAAARRHVRDRGLRNVQVLQADGRNAGLPSETFDLVTARLVLVNVPQPEKIVDEALRLVRPAGAVAFHEAEVGPQTGSLTGRSVSGANRSRGRSVQKGTAHRKGPDMPDDTYRLPPNSWPWTGAGDAGRPGHHGRRRRGRAGRWLPLGRRASAPDRDTRH